MKSAKHACFEEIRAVLGKYKDAMKEDEDEREYSFAMFGALVPNGGGPAITLGSVHGTAQGVTVTSEILIRTLEAMEKGTGATNDDVIQKIKASRPEVTDAGFTGPMPKV